MSYSDERMAEMAHGFAQHSEPAQMIAQLLAQREFVLRERDLWMKQCLDAEAKLKAYEDVLENCLPVNKEFRSNYSPPMIRLRWALDCPTELDRAVRERSTTV